MSKVAWKKGVPLREEEQERLRELVKEKGEKELAKEWKIGESAIVRAAAGLGLRSGTIHLLESRLKERAA